MLTTLLISLIIIVVFIASILFFPSVVIRKHTLKVYSLIPCFGALLLIMFNEIEFSKVVRAFTENTSVNPIKILVLFLSMTVFSLVLEQTGFFEYISTKVLEKSGNNQFVTFISLYIVISVLTVFTSNDIIILTFTPFICHFCKSAKISPTPYLIMEFIAANTWSTLLIIGNPTNIYICGAFGIDFMKYLSVMLLPTLLTVVASLSVMLLLFYRRLKKKMEKCEEHGKITDKPVMIISLVHLIICIVALAVSQYINVEMWIISLLVAISEIISVLICFAVRGRVPSILGKALSGMPFEIIPFVVGMFIIVMALDAGGATVMLAKLLGEHNEIFSYGLMSFISANVINNIPMSVLFSKILSYSSELGVGGIYATVIGSNIGAFLTPVGALAGIMWSNLLRKNGVKISFARFMRFGAVIGLPSILAALIGLSLVL
ncbi:MAG: hypothetical protein E7641_03940 [Ruminococcaceae bacterium]|nr:hypothetical protein [Oscillospiraceae bacterium]